MPCFGAKWRKNGGKEGKVGTKTGLKKEKRDAERERKSWHFPFGVNLCCTKQFLDSILRCQIPNGDRKEEPPMEEQYVSAKLSREDLIDIIRNIPDTVIAYDQDGNDIARSSIVVRHNQKRAEMAAQGGKTLVQIKQSEQELMYAVRNVLNTGKPMTFIHTAPHYECPTLFTVRPILDENEQVKFVSTRHNRFCSPRLDSGII